MFATLQSVPRTAQAACWGAEAGLAYKRLMSQYEDHDSQECKDAMSRTHQVLAEKLLQVCQNNGGVYIKAAQTFSTIQAMPKEYRKYAFTCFSCVVAWNRQPGWLNAVPYVHSIVCLDNGELDERESPSMCATGQSRLNHLHT